MANPLLAKRLNELLEATLIAAEPDIPLRALAETLISGHRGLIDELMEEWRLSYITRLLAGKRAQMLRAQRTAQLMLPGFERMPSLITVSEGRRKPLEGATFQQLREYLIVLRRRERDNPRIAQVKNLMDLMRKWKKKLKSKAHGLTVAEVMQREAGL
jgi:hypothetical protein